MVTPRNPPIPEDIVEATRESVKAAYDEGKLTNRDSGAIAALYLLASRLEDIRQRLINGEEVKDNASHRGYIDLSVSLGLTPSGRKALEDKSIKNEGKLKNIREQRAQRAA